jgi:hypothetical protein
MDEQLALAGAISDKFGGRLIALVKDESIVIDPLVGPAPSVLEVQAVVRSFISRRKDSAHYAMRLQGDVIVIDSPDPVAAQRKRRTASLPDNIKKCPFCSFVTPYNELYTIHVRAHGFM